MDKADYIDQYTKINLQQSFGLTNVDEPTYISNILGFVREAKAKLPPELSRIVKPKDFDHLDDNPAIGGLRLLPKVAKMSSIDHGNIKELKSRGIRSSLKDPLKTIQIVLNKIYGHILHFMEKEFHSKFKRFSPSVTGINEAIERISTSTTGDWGQSLEVQADFSDLYSNCEENLLKKHVRTGCILAGFSAETIEYIMRLIEIDMRKSYFKEPGGIYKTDRGFSMGDNSAADGSEIILRGTELEIFQKISDETLFDIIQRYLRFRDDLSLHLKGSRERMMKVLQIICTNYPIQIQLNTEVNVFTGKFLNLRIYNKININSPETTILRKSACKYVITPPNSNTNPAYKKCAGRTYFDMVETHCSSKSEKSRQRDVVNTILTAKGFNQKQIKKMQRRRTQTATSREYKQKLYTGKVTFDNVVSTHKFMRNVFQIEKFDDNRFSLPMKVPGKKLLQYIFTISKLREKLNF
jgi:hypothetical protein